MMLPGGDAELSAHLAEVEAERAALERELARRREEALAPATSRVEALALEVAKLEAATREAEARAPDAGRRAMQVQARHELARATGGRRRSPFRGLGWLPGTSLALGLAAFGLLLSSPLACFTLPGGVLAWLVGRERRDD